ncbi:radical SAM protein [Prochlorococcus sp. AH-716-B04]|nr:radical SAM protein [Prochlorococcus sp. AH-716-B04]
MKRLKNSLLNPLFNPNKLGYIILYVTNRCNFRCDFCFYYAEIDKGRKPNELTLDEIEKITKSAGRLVQLSMTGGEPFIRKDFVDLTRIALNNTRAKYVTIPTNGYLTENIYDYLNKILPEYPKSYFRLTLSIDGIGEEHDINRSKPGSYKKIVETHHKIKDLREKYSNLVLDSNTVFTANTEGRMIKILKSIYNDFEFDNHTVTYARGQIRDPNLAVKARKEYEDMNKMLTSLIYKSEKRFLYPIYRGVRNVSWQNLIATAFNDKYVTPCVAGRKMCVVTEEGFVKPCELLPHNYGNLRDFDYDIKTLLDNKAAKESREWIKSSKCKCTFECALAANVTWNISQYPRVVLSALNNI